MKMKIQQDFLDQRLDASLEEMQVRPLADLCSLFIQPCLHCAGKSQ